MNKNISLKAIIISLLLSATGLAQSEEVEPFDDTYIDDESPLLWLPEKSSITLKEDYVNDAKNPRKMPLIETIKVDLKGPTEEAAISREKYAKTIELLKSLRHFDEINAIHCWLDFHAHLGRRISFKKGHEFFFKKPDGFGTPHEVYTELGRRITIENRAACLFQQALKLAKLGAYTAASRLRWRNKNHS